MRQRNQDTKYKGKRTRKGKKDRPGKEIESDERNDEKEFEKDVGD
jgi:hypothetical protein